MHVGFRPIDFIILLVVVVPWLIGFGYVLPDADRRGQPGWLWAVLTIPLGWIALLAYLVVRSLQTS
jgi:hypothetical protein